MEDVIFGLIILLAFIVILGAPLTLICLFIVDTVRKGRGGRTKGEESGQMVESYREQRGELPTSPGEIVIQCKKCGEKSLWFNRYTDVYECFNKGCPGGPWRCSVGEFLSTPPFRGSIRPEARQEQVRPWYQGPQPRPKPPVSREFVVPVWLVNTLESKEFWAVLIGVGIALWALLGIAFPLEGGLGRAVGLGLPIGSLLAIRFAFRRGVRGYSTIAASRQPSYALRRIQGSSWLRLAIVLLVIAGLVAIPWNAYLLFTGKTEYPVNCTILLLAGIGFLIWLISVLRNSIHIADKPSFGAVFFSLLGIAVICAFVGVRPFSNVKDAVIQYVAAAQDKVRVSGGDSEDKLSEEELFQQDEGIRVVQNRQPPFSKTLGGEQVCLVDNKDASDPTWQQLVVFLQADKTDGKDYSLLSFPCGAFAEEVHNNAEAVGIRAAWVSVDFQDKSGGHALNAFKTTDSGLVYVDCTGGDVLSRVYVISPPGVEQRTFGGGRGWDKVAYVEIGKEYGLISLEVAASPGYACYEGYKERLETFEAMLEDYNRKVEAFNHEADEYSRWVTGRTVYAGSSEAFRAEQWYQELKMQEYALNGIDQKLEKEGRSLGAFWQPLGIVAGVEIFW